MFLEVSFCPLGRETSSGLVCQRNRPDISNRNVFWIFMHLVHKIVHENVDLQGQVCRDVSFFVYENGWGRKTKTAGVYYTLKVAVMESIYASCIALIKLQWYGSMRIIIKKSIVMHMPLGFNSF
jgi:hypothetical protein